MSADLVNRYRKLEADLKFSQKAAENLLPATAEATILDELDLIWWALTEAERAELDSAKP